MKIIIFIFLCLLFQQISSQNTPANAVIDCSGVANCNNRGTCVGKNACDCNANTVKNPNFGCVDANVVTAGTRITTDAPQPNTSSGSVPAWVIIVAIVCSLLICFLILLLIQLKRTRVTLDDFALDVPEEEAQGFAYANKFNAAPVGMHEKQGSSYPRQQDAPQYAVLPEHQQQLQQTSQSNNNFALHFDRDRRVQQVNSLAREQYGPTLAAKITDNMVLDEDEETIGQGYKCNVCAMKFAEIEQFVAHIETHPGL